MPTLYVCRGIPASGKSTYTRQMTVQANGTMKRICKDELRLMLDGTHDFGVPHRDWLTKIVRVMTRNAIEGGFDVVLDETFVQSRDLTFIADWFFSLYRDGEFTVLDFSNVPFEQSLLRDAARHPSLGRDVLQEYQDILEKEGKTNEILQMFNKSLVNGSWEFSNGRKITVKDVTRV